MQRSSQASIPSLELLEDLLGSEARAWAESLLQIEERNARLACIVSELLIKNQRLRYTLELASKLQGRNSF